MNDCIGQFSPLCVSELPWARIYPEVHIHPMQSYFSVQDLLCAPSLQQGLPIFPSVGKLLDNISVSSLANQSTYNWRASNSQEY